MRKLILIISILFVVKTNSQESKRKIRPLIWTTHSKNTDIIGVSVGFYPTDINSEFHHTRTFGIRLEPYVFSPFLMFAPKMPKKSSVTQTIYGVNISTGSFEKINTNGISLTGFFNNINKSNGISITGLSSHIEEMNGISIALGGNSIIKGNGIMIGGPWSNAAKKFNGLQISFENTIITSGSGIQIGFFNNAKNYKGIQIGLWNKNEKRSLPIINWNF